MTTMTRPLHPPALGGIPSSHGDAGEQGVDEWANNGERLLQGAGHRQKGALGLGSVPGLPERHDRNSEMIRQRETSPLSF